MSRKIIEKIIAPSILSADLAKLGEECSKVANAGAKWLHIDVMDNHYVPNLTFGPIICQAIKNYGVPAILDVHLMVEPVDRLITDFANSGADYITIHPEATKHLDRSLNLIKDSGCKAGLAFNPTSIIDEKLLDLVIEKIDLILLMSVNPGYAAQHFIANTLEKISSTKRLLDSKYSAYQVRLSVDGGVKVDNIATINQAGADTFVAGSAIFHADDYQAVIQKMLKLID